ncbi:hypothetical protein ACFSAV_04130 [Pasteurella oralis]|uniref:Uncharacterized protein n=1 Tax=Pasteurella oralis TaxID=1071947 RepID=A0ABW4NSH6_9PAST
MKILLNDKQATLTINKIVTQLQQPESLYGALRHRLHHNGIAISNPVTDDKILQKVTALLEEEMEQKLG